MSDVLTAARIVEQLGPTFRSARARRGRTLRDVAAETGVSFNTLSRLEREIGNITSDNIVRVLRWVAGGP